MQHAISNYDREEVGFKISYRSLNLVEQNLYTDAEKNYIRLNYILHHCTSNTSANVLILELIVPDNISI